MNKKGYFGKFVFGMIGLFILIMILVVLLPVQQGGVSPENITISLDNTSTNILPRFETNDSNSPVVNLAYSFIHFILYSSFEVVKAGVNYSIENPSFINAHNLLILILISLCIPIIYYGLKFLIIIILLLHEWYLVRKDKKRLKIK